jgi:hypothetical protein
VENSVENVDKPTAYGLFTAKILVFLRKNTEKITTESFVAFTNTVSARL